MRILDLPLKKEWYEMIESGIKTLEALIKYYSAITPIYLK